MISKSGPFDLARSTGIHAPTAPRMSKYEPARKEVECQIYEGVEKRAL